MIQYDKDFFESLDRTKIQSLLEQAKPYFAHREELYQRYLRKADANGTMSTSGKRVAVPVEFYIVNMIQGYLSGKAPTYTVSAGDGDDGRNKADTYLKKLDDIRRYNDDGSTFTELIHDYIVTAAAYAYISENENNEIVYIPMSSRDTIVIRDYSAQKYPVAMIRVWTEKHGDTDEQKIEIITAESKRIFNAEGELIPFEDYGESGAIQTMTEKRLFWNDVPVVAFEHPDGVAVFEPAIDLIDAYENLITNIRNMTQYNDNAKLLISGYLPQNPMFITGDNGEQILNPARQAEDRATYEAPTVFLDGDGKMEWLIKNVNYNGILDVLTRIQEQITMLTGVPNLQDMSFAGNASGVALGYKLHGLNQYAATTDRIFKRGYLRLWEIVTNRLNLKADTDYDFRMVNIEFVRNEPTDRDREMERAIRAKGAGLLSTETAIAVSGVETDPTDEAAKMNSERLQIPNVQSVIDLYAEGLIDRQTALERLYDKEKAAEMLTRLDERETEEAGDTFPMMGATSVAQEAIREAQKARTGI